MVCPADRPSAPDMPGLIYSHRNRPSLSSTSTVDSDEYVYGDRSNINFKRRPGTTNSRGIIPTLAHRPSSNRRLSSTTADSAFTRFREDDAPSSYAKTKAWKDAFATTAPSPIPTPSFIDSTSSDDEYPLADAFIDARQDTLKERSALKNIHRVSLPAYFSRLSVGGPRSPPEAPTSIDQAQSLPSSKSPKSPRSRSAYGASISTSTSTVVGAFKGITPTTFHPPTSLSHLDTIHASATPRGRGRERRARVRQGASRSPPGHRLHSPSISSLEMSRPASPLPTIPLLSQKETTERVTLAGRGRDPVPRALAPACGSLGGRILREAQAPHPSPKKNTFNDEELTRGRRVRKVGESSEERERGRSRLVVRRAEVPSITAL